MRELTTRKNLRLNGYDYRQNGIYFVTICVKDKHEILGSIVVGANCVRPHLSEIGTVVDKEISVLLKSYENITVAIENDGRTQFAPTISRIIKQFKGSITKQIGFSIWQKSFHDRIIRSEIEYQKIWQYIDQNPTRWTEDKYYIYFNIRTKRKV